MADTVAADHPAEDASASPTWAPRPEGYRLRLFRRVLAAALCICGTGLVAYGALRTTTGQAIDTVLMESIGTWNGLIGPLEPIIRGVVSVPATAVIALVASGVAVARRRPTLAARAVVVVLGANATTQVIKALLDRPDLGVTTVLQNSLPSGHVTFAVSVALALVIVAPNWLRGPAAWIGWIWASLMGVTVMVLAWHRPSDATAAVLVAGAWALLLAPVEHRQRHGVVAQRVMEVLAAVCVVVAVVGVVVALRGVDLMTVAAPSTTDYGFAIFLESQPWRERLMAIASALWVTGLVGIIVHEVDRLSWS